MADFFLLNNIMYKMVVANIAAEMNHAPESTVHNIEETQHTNAAP